MDDPYDLHRFISAQENSYSNALKEIKNGRKTSHWMWFIFPQYKELGKSETAKKYAIKSKEEAIAYFNHDVLGKRLVEISQAFLQLEGKTANEIMGRPDDFKLKSSMTLFDLV